MKPEKLYWKIILRSSNQSLRTLFILSFTWLSIYDFFLTQIPALPHLGFLTPLGIITMTLTTGFVTGYIVYFLTIHVPFINRKLSVELYVREYL
jgi:hypothetical protein